MMLIPLARQRDEGVPRGSGGPPHQSWRTSCSWDFAGRRRMQTGEEACPTYRTVSGNGALLDPSTTTARFTWPGPKPGVRLKTICVCPRSEEHTSELQSLPPRRSSDLLPNGEREWRAAGSVHHHRQIHLAGAEARGEAEDNLRLSVGWRGEGLHGHRLAVDGHLQTARIGT